MGKPTRKIQNIHQRIAASNRGNELRQQTTALRQSIAGIDKEERENRDLVEELVLLKKKDKDLKKKIVELKNTVQLTPFEKQKLIHAQDNLNALEQKRKELFVMMNHLERTRLNFDEGMGIHARVSKT